MLPRSSAYRLIVTAEPVKNMIKTNFSFISASDFMFIFHMNWRHQSVGWRENNFMSEMRKKAIFLLSTFYFLSFCFICLPLFSDVQLGGGLYKKYFKTKFKSVIIPCNCISVFGPGLPKITETLPVWKNYLKNVKVLSAKLWIC